MSTKVTEQGLFLPKEFFGDAEEVEIYKEHDRIIIVPTAFKDPILALGQQPIVADVDDASVNHDAYLHQ